MYAPFIRHSSFDLPDLPDRREPSDRRVFRLIYNPRISYKKYIFHITHITTNTNILSNLLYYTNEESEKRFIFPGLHIPCTKPKYTKLGNYMFQPYLGISEEEYEDYLHYMGYA